MLFDTEAMLAVPDCPELESDHDDDRIVLFQKINRYLFEELDSTLEQYLNAEMPNASTISSLSGSLSIIPDLPVPVIERAVNILEQLNYTIYLNLESHHLCASDYFEVMMFPSGTTDRAKLLSAFVDRLRNTMCYPARVSILTSSLA